LKNSKAKNYKRRVHDTRGTSTNNIENSKRWAVFTYVGRETRHNKIIQISDIKTAFRTANTLKKTFTAKTENERKI
jgi:hypothetical protein